MVRVLQVFASLDMGGAESRMMDIYRKIDRDKFQFDFVTLQNRKQYYEDEIQSLGGRVLRLHSPRNVGMLRHIQELRKCIIDGQYKAVHAHTSYHCGCVMLAAFLEHVPVRVAHARTNGSIQGGIKTKLFVVLGRALNALFATDRIAISEEAGKFVFGSSSFEVVPNAIDLTRFEHLENKEKLKKELGIPQDCFVIGHVGRFDQFKNQRFALNWFAQFPKRDESMLVLVGDGEQRNEMEVLVENLGIRERVVFTGVRSDVPELMNMFNVLIFPSTVEGLGGAVLEAQAARTPVVMSDTVPQLVDLGMGLVKRCSLSAGYDLWNRAILNSRNVTLTHTTINKQFSTKGYSLKSVVEKMQSMYCGRTQK